MVEAAFFIAIAVLLSLRDNEHAHALLAHCAVLAAHNSNNTAAAQQTLRPRPAGSSIYSSPISSFHISGCSRINPASRSEHSLESRSITFTPIDLSHSIPPAKLLLSPTTTVRIPNCRISPLQYQQGAS